jgi:hypothetical protein
MISAFTQTTYKAIILIGDKYVNSENPISL